MNIEIDPFSQEGKSIAEHSRKNSLYSYMENEVEKGLTKPLDRKGKQVEIKNINWKSQQTHNNKISRGRIYENQEIELSVAMHNINGLKSNN